jgi:hypothetical protein
MQIIAILSVSQLISSGCAGTPSIQSDAAAPKKKKKKK